MVKLDSWETRAEKAAERRKESKLRKHQRDQTRLNKSNAQQLLVFLQQHNDSILSSSSSSKNSLMINIWTDSAPTNGSFAALFLDSKVDELTIPAEKGNQRPRSHSKEENALASTPQRGSKSNSDSTKHSASSSGKKKRGGRARSGSNASDNHASNLSKKTGNQEGASPNIPKLCVNHFFGTCSSSLIVNGHGNGNRRALSMDARSLVPACCHGCHPSSKFQNPSLSSVLLKGDESLPKILRTERLQSNEQALLDAKGASVKADFGDMPDPDEPLGIDMLYHIQIPVPIANYGADNSDKISLSECISSTFAESSCPIGSLVYLTLDDVLVFDRYRDGLVLSDSDEELLLFGGSKRRTVTIGEPIIRSRSASINESASVQPIQKGADAETILDMHQRLVRDLPGQVLEYLLTFLPMSSTAVLTQVCRAWYNEIGRSSPDLWKHLMDRNHWPHDVPQEIMDSPSAGEDIAAAYKSSFLSHYTAVRTAKAVVLGFQQLLGNGTGSSTVDKQVEGTKDVATFEFKNCTGRPISGRNLIRFWSEKRVLLGNSDDCTLHLYDVIDSSHERRRCKPVVRVSVAPIPTTRKRACTLIAIDLDNQAIGCLFDVTYDDTFDYLLGVLQRDDLLCSGEGGSAVPRLEDGMLQVYNLQAKVLDFIASCNDNSVLAWLYRFAMDSEGIDFSVLRVVISSPLVACGDGEFLFKASISVEAHEESMISVLSRVFQFSSNFGEIVWMSTSNIDVLDSTLKGLGPAGRDRFNDTPNAAFFSRASEVVTLKVNGPRDVKATTFRVAAASFFAPTIAGLDSGHLILSEHDHLQIVSTTKSTILSDIIPEEDTLLSVVPLKDGYTLLFGTASLDDEMTDWGHFLRLLHVPTGKMLYGTIVQVDNGGEFLDPSYSIDCMDDLVAVTIDDVGLFLAGMGVQPMVSSSSSDKKVKKKKGKNVKGPKKDGFARGMSKGR